MRRATDPSCQWDYKSHGNYPAAMHQAISDLFRDSLNQPDLSKNYCSDPRTIHGALFKNLTDANNTHFAGNYRGSALDCLVDAEVTFGAKIGAPAMYVLQRMSRYRQFTKTSFTRLVRSYGTVDDSRFRLLCATAAGTMFHELVSIHPFWDGNGHAARAVVALTWLSYGYLVGGWVIDPRPTSFPYLDYLREWDRGNRDPLIQHMLGALVLC